MKFNRLILFTTGFTLLVAVVIGFDLNHWVRGGYGWRWPYEPIALAQTLPLIVTLIGFLIISNWILHKENIRLLLAWSVIGSVTIALAVTYAREGEIAYPLFTRTVSGGATTQHWAAARIDWQGGEWQQWTDVMYSIGSHVGTSPPGIPMLYGGLNDGLRKIPPLQDALYDRFIGYQCHNYDLLDYSKAEWASALFGMLMPLWAALTVLPLYATARRLAGVNAQWIAIFWPVVPGIAAFGASWSTAFPLFSALAFWLFLKGHEDGLRWMLGAGFITGFALFLNFTFLPLLGLFGLFTLINWWFHERETVDFGQLVIKGIVFTIGLSIVWVVFLLAGGQSFFEILQASFDYHLDLERNYWFWVGMHVWDWLLWTGIGLGVLWLWSVGQGIRDRKPPVLGISLVVTVLIMTLSATTRGESGRIWLFLSPFVLITAFHIQERRSLWMLTIGQSVLMVALTVNLAVMGTEMSKPIAPSVSDGVTYQPADVTFNNTQQGAVFRLVGWSAQKQDDHIEINLRWQGIQRPENYYWFGATFVGPETISVSEWQPRQAFGQEERYPTTCWTSNQIVEDKIVVPLPTDGEYWMSLAVFGDAGHPEGRLQVTNADGSTDVQVGLGPIIVGTNE